MSLTIYSADHEFALARFASTSKRNIAGIAKQEFGLLLTEVAKYTPPASPGVAGKKAEVQGKEAVAGDIYAIYGTPSKAYDAIHRKASWRADAFWSLYQAGDSRAAQIVRETTGQSFSPFDGGTLHKRQKRVGMRNRRHQQIYFVSNPAELEAYVKQKQGNVWWLASGWAPALKALGRPLPTGVRKHSAPGAMRVEIGDVDINITAINSVEWASRLKGIEARVRWAMNRRTETLERRWNYFIQNTRL
jgi:hypothetical protein